MKRIFLAILTICSFAAQSQNDETGVIVASEFHITRPLTEIFRDNPVDENRNFGGIESSDRQHRIPANFPFTVADGPAYGNDERTLQNEMGNRNAAETRASWAGQTASGFRPYDPSGAVGPAIMFR